MRMSPWLGVSCPAIMRSIVVLPQPLGPEQAAIGAMGNAQAHIVNRYHVAEALGDRNEFDIASSGI